MKRICRRILEAVFFHCVNSVIWPDLDVAQLGRRLDDESGENRHEDLFFIRIFAKLRNLVPDAPLVEFENGAGASAPAKFFQGVDLLDIGCRTLPRVHDDLLALGEMGVNVMLEGVLENPLDTPHAMQPAR